MAESARRVLRLVRAVVALLSMWPVGAPGAEPLPGRDWPWTAVGRVLIDGDGPCSGALVAPRTVLTVGHCVAGSGWQAQPADRLSFALESGTHRVSSVHLASRSPFASDGTIEDLQFDWALLELEESPAVAPVPYGGPAAARRALDLDEPLVKVGWGTPRGEPRRVRDFVCRIQELSPGEVDLLFRCPGGAGAGRSGSALIRREGEGFELVAVQSAITLRGSVEFGIAVAPPIEIVHDRMPGGPSRSNPPAALAPGEPFGDGTRFDDDTGWVE